MAESHQEQVSRVEQMARDERGVKWDLSNNDRAALLTVLNDRSSMLLAASIFTFWNYQSSEIEDSHWDALRETIERVTVDSDEPGAQS